MGPHAAPITLNPIPTPRPSAPLFFEKKKIISTQCPLLQHSDDRSPVHRSNPQQILNYKQEFRFQRKQREVLSLFFFFFFFLFSHLSCTLVAALLQKKRHPTKNQIT